jgi:hypothetical protein
VFSRLPILGLLLCFSACASEELNSPTPAVFTEETAMRAIYGGYSVERKGTILSQEVYPTGKVEILASAILTRTYVEASVNKGVLVVQRQSFDENGRNMAAHPEGADISVYIFRHDGTKWVFEKGKKTVVNTGSFGEAPAAGLIKLGAEKYGVLFEPSYQQMGYVSTDIFIVGISEPEINVILTELDMSGDNEASDICIEDEAAGKCWRYQADLNFFEKRGSDYYVIEHKLGGTSQGEGTTIIPIDGIKYYEKSASKYQPSASRQRPETTPMSMKQVLVP